MNWKLLVQILILFTVFTLMFFVGRFMGFEIFQQH